MPVDKEVLTSTRKIATECLLANKCWGYGTRVATLRRQNKSNASPFVVLREPDTRLPPRDHQDTSKFLEVGVQSGLGRMALTCVLDVKLGDDAAANRAF